MNQKKYTVKVGEKEYVIKMMKQSQQLSMVVVPKKRYFNR